MRQRHLFLLLFFVLLLSSCKASPMSTENDNSSDAKPTQIINNNLKASPEQCAPNGVAPWDFLFDHVCISIQSILLKTNISQNNKGLYSEVWVNGLICNDSSDNIMVDLKPKLTNPDGTIWELYKNWEGSNKYSMVDFASVNGEFNLVPNSIGFLGVRFYSDEISPSPEGYTLTFTAHGMTVSYELDALLP